MVDILPPETEKDKPQTNGRGKPEALAPDLDVAVNFLKRLHPGAPWETLTAIVPDGDTKTRSFADPADWCTFISAQNVDRNVYYPPNRAQAPMNKKAEKKDIAEIWYLHAES